MRHTRRLLALGAALCAATLTLISPAEFHAPEEFPSAGAVRLEVSPLGEEAVVLGAVWMALQAAQDLLFTRTNGVVAT